MANKVTKGIHSGHRVRMKNKIIDSSAKSLPDHELLEVILYNTIKQGNTNNIAHNLLNTFGSIRGVLNADINSLQSVDGIGEASSVFISTLQQVFARALQEEVSIKSLLKFDEIIKHIVNLFAFDTTEKVYLICADARYNVKATMLVSEGEAGTVEIDINKICQKAVMINCRFALITHNHIYGSLQPSEADFRATKTLVQRLYASGIVLVDHIIVKGKNFLSFKQNDVVKSWFNVLLGSGQNVLEKIDKSQEELDSNGEKLDTFLFTKFI